MAKETAAKSDTQKTRDFPFERDPVIEAYKKDIDRTLIRGNLMLNPAERFLKFESFMSFTDELREMGRRAWMAELAGKRKNS